MYNSIDIKEIDKVIISNIHDNNTNKNILLDIRDKYEYNLSHIDKAINIPYSYLLALPKEYLNYDNTYYIYCNSGNKSKRLCEILNEKGYKTIDLIGGYKAYIDG